MIAARVLLATLLLAVSGCDFGRSETVTIATTWNQSDRLKFDKAFQRWSTGKAVRLRWISLEVGDDLNALVDRSEPPDLILGASGRALRKLHQAKRLEPLEAGGPPWRVARRSVLGIATQESASAIEDHSLPAFDDFRYDPISLEWADWTIQGGAWKDGYAELVRLGGVSRRPGRQSFSALAALERGEVASAVSVLPEGSGPWRMNGFTTSWDEGIALVRGSRALAPAREFLRGLAEAGEIGPPNAEEIERSSEGETLFADLLGATLVDAQEDLWNAASALRKVSRGGRAEHWMGEAPPWPPASVEKLLKSPNGMALVETLAAQIAPEASTRAWLIRSWLAPSRLIDGRLLDELVAADGGKLVLEPRFRTWLRSEWTAWARQRYRRVARLADSGEADR